MSVKNRFLYVFSAVSGILVGMAHGQTGIIMVEPQLWASPGEAVGMEYTSYIDHTGYWTISKPRGAEEQVDRRLIAAIISYPSPAQFPDIATKDDATALANQIDSLTGNISKFPNARKFLAPRIATLSGELSRYRAGQRKYESVWYSQADYTKRVQQDAATAAEAERRRKEQAEVKQRENERLRREQQLVAQQQSMADKAAPNQQIEGVASTPVTPVASEDVDSHIAQAESISRTGDIQGAISAYEKALEINPADSSIYVKLGMLCINYSLQNRGIGDSMDLLYKARDAFGKAIRLNSSNPDAYLGRGVVFDQLVKPEQALADLTKAIELAPKSAEAYKRRADVFYRMDRNEQAISDYTKALAIRPDYRDALGARERAQKEVSKAKGDQKAWTEGRPPEGFDAQVEASRQKAFQAYPEVRDGSTELARRVGLVVQGASQTNPELLHDPEWPFKITKAVAEQLTKEQSDAWRERIVQIDKELQLIQSHIESWQHVMDVSRGLLVRKGQVSEHNPKDEIEKLEARKQQLLLERKQ